MGQGDTCGLTLNAAVTAENGPSLPLGVTGLGCLRHACFLDCFRETRVPATAQGFQSHEDAEK